MIIKALLLTAAAVSTVAFVAPPSIMPSRNTLQQTLATSHFREEGSRFRGSSPSFPKDMTLMSVRGNSAKDETSVTESESSKKSSKKSSKSHLQDDSGFFSKQNIERTLNRALRDLACYFVVGALDEVDAHDKATRVMKLVATEVLQGNRQLKHLLHEMSMSTVTHEIHDGLNWFINWVQENGLQSLFFDK